MFVSVSSYAITSRGPVNLNLAVIREPITEQKKLKTVVKLPFNSS